MKLNFFTRWHLAGALLILGAAGAAAHDHIAVGLIDTNGTPGLQKGDQLALIGGSLSGNVYHMLWETPGERYSGYYSLNEKPRTLYPNDSFGFVAASDGQTLPDGLNHAATGSYLWMEITSVSGPSGAHFGFWDESVSYFQSTPTISFLTNTPTGGFKFEISDPLEPPPAPPGAILEPNNMRYMISGDTSSLPIDPSEDPFGHIHNRGFTVDQPGEYYIGFTIYDMSANGTAGAPLHPHSETYIFHFQAVPEPSGAALLGVGLLTAVARRRFRR